MKKYIFFLGFIALGSLVGCGSKQNHEQHEKMTYIATSPIVKDTVLVKEYVSQIHSIQHIELRSQEKGYLDKIYVDEGQHVKKGQLLFQIMPNLYKADLEKAKAEVHLVEIEYENTKILSDKNVVSKNELAMAKAKLEKAKAELALAQVHLNFTQIRAPFDGIIDSFHVRLGSLVDEGDLLTSLSDNSKMWVYYNVPEAEYLDFKTHTSEQKSTVRLLMANNQFFPYSGVVETIEADFNNETGTIPFRATFKNPEHLLRHGETGNIHMPLAVSKAMIIPQKATYEVLDKKYVFVIDNQNKVHSKEIKIGAELEDLYLISSGISKSDKILLEGIAKVKDNDIIEYKFQDPKTVISQLKVYAE